MADFRTAYNITKDNAGGYVLDPNDPGGETYRDISRKYNPTWTGWDRIDQIKKQMGGKIAKNFTEKSLDELAAAFYKQAYWNKLRLDELKSQPNANQLFDQLLDGIARTVQMTKVVLNKLYNYNTPVDSLVNDTLMWQLDKAGESQFFNAFKQLRTKRFQYAGGVLTPSDPDYKFFAKFGPPPSTGHLYLKGWLNRVNKYSMAIATGGATLLIIAAIFLITQK